MFSDALTLIGKSYGLDTEQSLTLPLYEWNETEKDLQYRHDTLLICPQYRKYQCLLMDMCVI